MDLVQKTEKYGPVVRLAPNEISVNSVDALRTVYVGGFEKHRWYLDVFANYGSPNIFTLLGHKPHSVQKRMVSNVYSKSYLQNSKDLQTVSSQLIFDRFLPIIQETVGYGGDMDVLDFTEAVGMDFTSAYLFGLSNSTDFIKNAEYRRHWLKEFQTFKIRLPHERAGGEIEGWCFSMCEAADAFIHSEKLNENPSATQPVVYRQLSQSLGEPTQPNAPQFKNTMVAIASEMLDQLIAGHETSGITLTYLMHELSQRPCLQDSLRSELLTLSPPIIYPATNDTTNTNMAQGLPSPRSIDALPLLNNILQETLRLYAASPAQQPRVTPFSPTGTTIDGYSNISGGIRVSANPYSLHRNAAVFPEPEKWVPERWDAEGEKRDEMKRWFWAFSSGGRMCLGNHFALQDKEMKLVVAAVYSNYMTEIVDGEGMEQADTFVSGPVGGKCVLRFKHV
ncbi:MAG: hypothetical protein ALECFALPRED_000435 [Alectoria fallacina]|uniref:Cytochrome P450 n=1 Tax=Alectoria fallacina TaxID=1903189 RepID=A0A8H3IJN6_9LECA|nr:MAG: hypothetical protein ALECFALPRED_000435 [Alectoria fallacina]